MGLRGDKVKREIISLTRNTDFRRAYQKGKSFVSPVLVSYVRKNRLKLTRVGITVSKKVGCAVVRNRSRRVIREAYRSLMFHVKPGYDLVFVARGKTPFVKSGELEKVMLSQLKEAGAV